MHAFETDKSLMQNMELLCTPSTPLASPFPVRDALASLDAAIAFHRQQQQQPPSHSISCAPRLRPSDHSTAAPYTTTPNTTAMTTRRPSTRAGNSVRGKLYRSRRKKYTDGLGDHVEALRKEVEDLELYRRTQHTTLQHARYLSLPCASNARVVCEYFSLFEFGVPVIGHVPALRVSGPSSSSSSTAATVVSSDVLAHSSRQAGFLDSMMAPSIAFGGERGVRVLLEQWERYSEYHASLRLVLERLDVVVADPHNPVVSATAKLRVRFSRRTIEKIFPHILGNAPLVAQLIGKEIDYPVGNTFYFGRDGKIHGYETEVDFVAAFTDALGSITAALELVGHARIKQQHLIGEDTERGDGGATEYVVRGL